MEKVLNSEDPFTPRNVVHALQDVLIVLRTKSALKQGATPECIEIWALKDALRPELALDPPSIITAFCMNPVNPRWLAGGCANGQVVLWDLQAGPEQVSSLSLSCIHVYLCHQSNGNRSL